MTATGLIPIDVKEKDFNILMGIYREAANRVYNELIELKENLFRLYGYDVINNVTSRVKTPSSIINKMKKKNYEFNYKNLIDNIDDIAGVRVICPLKSDIFTIIDLIEIIPDLRIIETKDFITKPKKSGYSGYHIIAEVPVKFEEKEILIKVEIQLRTMAMDFWATNEHKIKYKSDKKLSFFDSKRLTVYAKLLYILDEKIMKLHHKQRLKEIKNNNIYN